ncbi:MAG: DUF397 domain-containing protein [Pseudonocardiaceae bacterium]|nr:DUF397 domain-containing protein [Pseudonocardiaceae bacterium]
MAVDTLATATWHKSSFSGGGNNCVDVAVEQTIVGVRDSKNYGAGHLTVNRSEWAGFLAAVKDGEINR